MTTVTVEYYYKPKLLTDSGSSEVHFKVDTVLNEMKKSGKISEFTVQEVEQAFPTENEEKVVLKRLRGFGMRHRVKLSQLFGSRRYGFWHLPSQFILVKVAGELAEVFPHQSGDTIVGVKDFLDSLEKGVPWTRGTIASKPGTKHEQLLNKIVADPGILEPGLTIIGRNVQVSRDFGELGIIDLAFKDGKNAILLVEVKVKPEELDKAIGQILKYRRLFAQEKLLEEDSVRVAIACPYIPPMQQEICEKAGIKCYQV